MRSCWSRVGHDACVCDALGRSQRTGYPSANPIPIRSGTNMVVWVAICTARLRTPCQPARFD